VTAAAFAGVAALALAVTLPHTLGSRFALGLRLEQGLDALGGAKPLGLWLGCGLFVVSLLCSAGAHGVTRGRRRARSGCGLRRDRHLSSPVRRPLTTRAASAMK
jgi:hypothetical protein